MSLGLNEDLAAVRGELDRARQEVQASLDQLTDEDLDRSRRGGWSVRRVVQHLIQSEWHYARLVSHLRGLQPTPPLAPPTSPASVPDAVRALSAARQALLDALDGIDEASFYRLGTVGREEYSVLSVLENAAHHDREHVQQIRSIVAPTYDRNQR